MLAEQPTASKCDDLAEAERDFESCYDQILSLVMSIFLPFQQLSYYLPSYKADSTVIESDK